MTASRYLKIAKEFIGLFTKRIFLKISVSDYKNSYIIYSNKATNIIIIKCGKIGDGFIILLEILMELYLNMLNIDEISTIFFNRRQLESSTRINLIYESFIGLIKIYLKT